MSNWTDPAMAEIAATAAAEAVDTHEVRELRWRIKALHKQIGRQGETIHQLRCELAYVRGLNSKVERGEVQNLERAVQARDQALDRQHIVIEGQSEVIGKLHEKLDAATRPEGVTYPGFSVPDEVHDYVSEESTQ